MFLSYGLMVWQDCLQKIKQKKIERYSHFQVVS